MFSFHLLRPFAYWSIKFEKKWQLDWGIPAVLTIMSVAALVGASHLKPIMVLGDSGLLAKMLSFVQSLPGFYIAALAAIATFNRIDIDRIMPAPPPRMNVNIRGRSIAIDLTRRRFLCVLLAFLTAESLVLIMTAMLGLSAGPSLKLAVTEEYQRLTLYSCLAIYMLFFWQMLCVTFLGLFYLGERIHQPDDTP
ncbi:MAG: hypothetical protein IOC39_25755 [Burkholderia sp.]|jgi:hypothetical protein|uniref:hypothetical protein n=1 Tax=Burkholderia sp. TaxID=36773 RepID=UPI0025854CA5|nr:hypothetical protein [Burkholderia sp.]MCA3643446.1 hypothetical protein [Methylobacterium sp.]MCA3776717.1 hypothetical protein [Burkholderia sp.]MCA3784655.1 hypothetical protein [Burkholderia sp.]MCA3798286.1 hypothetical protein [Burkholderia sp.]MCA3802268.1 hypothetical protein [Burkholderia sp.]